MRPFCQNHKRFQRAAGPRSQAFCKPPSSRWSKNVKALMDWNVNRDIYHDAESKLLHGRGKRTCQGVPWGAALSERLTSSICYNILPERCSLEGVSPLEKRVKNEKQLHVTNEKQWTSLLLQWQRLGLASTPCQAGSLVVNHLPARWNEPRAVEMKTTWRWICSS